ncbi:hypothetical protein AVEN_165904-1 [Araneus ventricosus]|uniref:PiggyBac transposable element-derived protein domain-containing protein n=1 Tax=Araneus ventricosus TaxID=182803 RepID=A0A4Y2WDG6_ARAVE|nr:hypothetical protein AVEN_149642-1 [Araneus ventricosus]GBO35001.1 hypothetical protein AVEN_165904-1 [Araneus ventricosus]
MRLNRGVPKELAEIELSERQSCLVRKGDMSLVGFRDRRHVYVLTTKLPANFIEKTVYHKGGHETYYLKPKHIHHYNESMGDVDAVDQALEPYNCARKSYTWFKKLGLHIIHRMLLNANVFYNIYK